MGCIGHLRRVQGMIKPYCNKCLSFGHYDCEYETNGEIICINFHRKGKTEKMGIRNQIKQKAATWKGLGESELAVNEFTKDVLELLNSYVVVKPQELLEPLAELEHEQWSHMMDRVSNRICTQQDWERWRRQIKTSYSELSEREKECDREWARKVIEKLWS